MIISYSRDAMEQKARDAMRARVQPAHASTFESVLAWLKAPVSLDATLLTVFAVALVLALVLL